jgi:hypothetical protein
MKHIHITGLSPRTGTTLLAEAMISCFEIDEYTDHEDPIYALPQGSPDIFLTKRPMDILVAKSYLKLSPELYIICMIRDPRDIIVSKHRIAPDKYWANLRIWKERTKALRKIQSHPRVTSIYYEEFVTHPDKVQEQIAQRLPFLKSRGPFSRYHELVRPSEASLKALGRVRPIAPASVGSYRRHLPRVVGQMQLHGDLTPDLIDFGYERDDSWKQRLEGVEADLTPSFWPERRILSDRVRFYWKKYKGILKIRTRRMGLQLSKMMRMLHFGR